MAYTRKYEDSYIKFGSTLINDQVVEKGPCLVRYRV